MNRFTSVLVALTLATGLAACGGGYSGFIIPIESDLKPWVEPEADEILEEAGIGDEDEGDDEDYEEYEGDDDDDDDDVAPPKPADAATPPAPAAGAKAPTTKK